MVDKINATFEAEDMDTFIKASQLIFRSDIHQAGAFVNEMLMMHPILAFNPVTKHLDVIESVHINGGSIQMDIEEYEVAKIEEKTKECNCDCVKNHVNNPCDHFWNITENSIIEDSDRRRWIVQDMHCELCGWVKHTKTRFE